ncbi:MAG: hypothetical protein FWD89_00045 [Firmicutes bacterium]|nr:hypothetical protein [Bacillota bacterium]MCL2770693.1 hypothetical protein [Bacillota bacterium]
MKEKLHDLTVLFWLLCGILYILTAVVLIIINFNSATDAFGAWGFSILVLGAVHILFYLFRTLDWNKFAKTSIIVSFFVGSALIFSFSIALYLAKDSEELNKKNT